MKLEKFHYIEGQGNRMFLYGFILAVVLMILINLFFSQAKYLKTESIKIAQGTINYKPYDFKIMAMYQENDSGAYEEIEIMPTSGYVINEEKSYCTIDNINRDNNAVLNTNENGEHTIANLSKNDKCYLYFDIKNMIIQDILATKTISTRTDFSTTLTTDTTGTVFSAEDDYGTSYYFAGASTDNWVKFAGFYWRIIRINGDETIRMIYQGTAANTTGTGTQIGTSAFNSTKNNNMYVGYMYTSGQVHGTGTASTIKGVLDSWYSSNLLDYANYIATGSGATFCNDRQPSTSETSLNGSGGTGTTSTYYAGYIRLVNSKAPILKCADSADRFSSSIGLITADEVAYAGSVYGTENSNYYLYTGQVYWALSPRYFNSSGNLAWVFLVYSNGYLGSAHVDNSYGVRPVINLKADTTFADGGMGTADNPYVVQ